MPKTTFAVLLFLCVPGTVVGQVVQGSLIEQGTEEPIATALISLEAENGDRVEGVLTDQAGRFRISRLLPGRFRLVAQHIGHQTVRTDFFDLGLGERKSLRLSLEISPLRLSGLTAEPDRRCRSINETDAGIIASFWEEARKALDAAVWTSQNSDLSYEVKQYRRKREPENLDIIEEELFDREGRGAQPFRSLTAEDLQSRGYVRGTEEEGRTYLAPDAGALLSSAFLNNHCLRFHDDRSWADSVGIEFRPLGGGSTVDIRGTLWLDGQTFKLRRVEFSYTSLDIGVPTSKLGGLIAFEELITGAWIVRDWYIRMPQIGITQSRRRARRILVGISEVGGYVVAVTDAEGGSLRRSPESP